MTPPSDVVLTIGQREEALPSSIAASLRAAGLALHHSTEAEAQETLEAWVADDAPPPVVVITEGVPKPAALARLVHVATPLVQIVFLAGPERAAQLRRELPHAGIGHNWSTIDAAMGAPAVANELRLAVRATQKRAKLRTTLDRMNLKLEGAAPITDPAEYRRLVSSDRYLAAILEHAGDAILAVDARDCVTIWNRGAARLFGHDGPEVLERSVARLVDEERAPQLLTLIASARTGQTVEGHEIICRRSDGTTFDVEMTLAPVRNELGQVEAVSLVARDVSERKRQEEDLRRLNSDLEATLALLDAKRRELLEVNAKLEVQATTDPLTGLKNRMVFHNSLNEMIAVAARQHTPLSLLMIDIDRFKRINDTSGHLEGDRVLQAIAYGLRHHVREQDVVARFGGEEFALLLPNTELEDAVVLAESIRSTCERLTELPARVTVSIGAAEFTVGDTAVSLVDRADKALYHAKERGRNRVSSSGWSHAGAPVEGSPPS